MRDLEKFFDEHENEPRGVEHVLPGRRLGTNRDDLHAMLLLDRLVPGHTDMVAASEHDQVWFDVAPESLAAVASDEDLLDLIRCGVWYDACTDSMTKFV